MDLFSKFYVQVCRHLLALPLAYVLNLAVVCSFWWELPSEILLKPLLRNAQVSQQLIQIMIEPVAQLLLELVKDFPIHVKIVELESLKALLNVDLFQLLHAMDLPPFVVDKD